MNFLTVPLNYGQLVKRSVFDMKTVKTNPAAMLDELGRIGTDPTGGLTRFVYSDAWIQAQKWVLNKAQQSEMSVSFDSFGNGFMSYLGTDGANEIMSGSHIDTVKNAGQYDGAYGVVAAMLAMQELVDEYGQPRMTMTTISFSEEEGSRFPISFSGSLHYAGVLDAAPTLVDAKGIKFGNAQKNAITQLKTEFDCKEHPLPTKFIELHIEQGPQLEESNIPLGVVSAICEQKRYTVTITGQSNHAGTTPQHLRRDALKAASLAINRIDQEAQRIGEPFVFTVGEMTVKPGSPNVIPGIATFTIDIRHPDAQVVNHFEKTIKKVLSELNGVKTDLDCWMDSRPAIMAPDLVLQLQNIISEHSASYMNLPSGAGHDTQIMNQKVPTAMLFVPSHNGISHAPAEYTNPESLALGVSILKDFLYKNCY